MLSEPVNALSSLAYVAAGVWVWRHDRLQGTALIAAGAGSVAYHGPGGSGARWLHDSTIVLLAGVAALAARRVWRGAQVRPGLASWAAALCVVGVPLQLFGRTGGPLCRPDSLLQAHAGWHIATAAALAGAFVLAAEGAPRRVERAL